MSNKCCKPWIDEYMEQSVKFEELEDKLQKIDNWCKAYPLDMFPEPDLKRAGVILKAHGMTLGAISASSMRHVLKGIQKIIK